MLYYYSPSFFRTWSRKKMVINTSGSLSSIFSNSLRSFVKTKTFFNNDLSMFCLMRSCFLDAAQTLLRSNHPTQTCYCFSFVPTIFWRQICFESAPKKPPNLENHLNANGERLWLAQNHLRGRWLVILPHVKTAVHRSLIGCISFSHMWK